MDQQPAPLEAARWEVTAVRYATRSTTKADCYLGYELYGEADDPLVMDYFFYVLSDGFRTLLVDTGFAPAAGSRRGRTSLVPPLDALGRLGVAPESVSQVLVTHFHYDHIGNVAAFPAAELLVPGGSSTSGRAHWPAGPTSPCTSRRRRSSTSQTRTAPGAFAASRCATTWRPASRRTRRRSLPGSADRRRRRQRGADRTRLRCRALLRGARPRPAVRHPRRPRGDVRGLHLAPRRGGGARHEARWRRTTRRCSTVSRTSPMTAASSASASAERALLRVKPPHRPSQGRSAS